MKSKSTLFTVIFAALVVVFAVAAFLVIPSVMPKNSAGSSSSAPTSSTAEQITLNDLISVSDTVISGTVIKADVDSNGVLYTLHVTRVFKGRNYTSMGYAYLNGKQTLKFAENYLFFGATGEEKYHYYEPFKNAPWVYKISDQAVAEHFSNGDAAIVKDIKGATLENIKEICDAE